MLEKVTDKNLLSKSIFKHIEKNVFTNCFLTSKEFDEEIESGTLFVKEYQSNNLYLLKDRDEYVIMYFYINNKNAIGIEINDIKKEFENKKVVIEIAYKENQTISDSFEQMGFKKILNRVCLEKEKTIVNDITESTGFSIRDAFNDGDAEKIVKFLQNNFNKFTGCIPNINTINNRIANNEIYVLEDETSNIVGLLEFSIGNKLIIKHLAISEEYRGRGLAKYLISLLSLNQNKDITTWTAVNSDAERLYRKNGFVDTEYKSTVLIYEEE